MADTKDASRAAANDIMDAISDMLDRTQNKVTLTELTKAITSVAAMIGSNYAVAAAQTGEGKGADAHRQLLSLYEDLLLTAMESVASVQGVDMAVFRVAVKAPEPKPKPKPDPQYIDPMFYWNITKGEPI